MFLRDRKALIWSKNSFPYNFIFDCIFLETKGVLCLRLCSPLDQRRPLRQMKFILSSAALFFFTYSLFLGMNIWRVFWYSYCVPSTCFHFVSVVLFLSNFMCDSTDSSWFFSLCEHPFKKFLCFTLKFLLSFTLKVKAAQFTLESKGILCDLHDTFISISFYR